jgi:hypothetical protein
MEQKRDKLRIELASLTLLQPSWTARMASISNSTHRKKKKQTKKKNPSTFERKLHLLFSFSVDFKSFALSHLFKLKNRSTRTARTPLNFFFGLQRVGSELKIMIP